MSTYLVIYDVIAQPEFTEDEFFLELYILHCQMLVGARDIQELPPLGASSQMETAPMAGKSQKPSHEHPLN